MTTTPATLSTTIAAGGPWPVGVRASADQAAVITTGATSTTPFGFATAAQADAIVTLINELRTSCIAARIIKGAA